MTSRVGPKIVVIEDNVSVSQYLATVLEAVGYRVLTANTAKAGWELAVAEHPAVVLLDLHLPDMHGGKVLNAIRNDAKLKTTPVIVLTGSEKVSDVTAAVSRGASDYVTKPCDAATLLEKVGRHAPIYAARRA